MRALFRSSLRVLAVAAGLGVVGLLWLSFDERGLPDLSAAHAFAHPQSGTPSLGCLEGNTVVITYESLGVNMKKALNAAEAREDAPPFFLVPFLRRRTTDSSAAMLVSRRILCIQEKYRPLNEFRIALQLERRYSKQDLFAMMANTADFGSETVGVEAASRRLYHKHSSDLSISEAALIAGMISQPIFYSPATHPDQALARRNQVIDQMLRNGSITTIEAATAKAVPLSVAAR